MKNKNIVIFSSGISEKHGITENIKNKLNEMGYSCVDWRGLFAYANHSDHIALLPTLIKKIPTFDFAVLICEGHDITYISRGEDSETVKTMRDNVLFEIGLCAMAIGLNRTIIVTDKDVRLPDDLMGVDGKLALKQIAFEGAETASDMDFVCVCNEIDNHIRQESDCLHQVVIGAAASGACGYASNFICRILEHIDDGLEIIDSDKIKNIRVPIEKVYIHIILPNNLDSDVLSDIKKKQASLLRGRILSARNRPVEFNCFFDENDALHIVDYPTNVVTSYDTARMILQMDADDSFDETASERFVEKELSLHESTLKNILNKAFAEQIVEEHYSGTADEVKEKMVQNITDVITKRLTIERYFG